MQLPEKLTVDYLKQYAEQDKELSLLCKKFNNKIVLMPLSKNAAALKNYLSDKQGISIAHFIDNNPLLNNTEFEGKQVFNLASVRDSLKDKFIILTGMKSTIDEISSKLNDTGITNHYCLYEPFFLIDLITKNIQKYNNVYASLSDDLSKQTLINLLIYHLTQKDEVLKEIARPLEKQYFESDIYEITQNDHFVDCGAYTGDTMEQLLSLTGGTIEGYYGFEPFESTFKDLQAKAAKHNINTDHLFQNAVTSEECLLKFQDSVNSDPSKFSQNDTGNFLIKGLPIDTVLKGKHITFIKMDIEGAEGDALKGAENTIRRQKPTLAISAYHKFNDLWELPRLIDSFKVGYKYYLRHYTHNISETVLYCVA